MSSSSRDGPAGISLSSQPSGSTMPTPTSTTSVSPASGIGAAATNASKSRFGTARAKITAESETLPNVRHIRSADRADLEDRYAFAERIGIGSFGTVYRVQEKETEIIWAAKCIKKRPNDSVLATQVQREVTILKRVSHPHIVKLKEVYETPKEVILIQEFCDGGSIVSQIKKHVYSEATAKIILRQLSDSIGYLHDCGVVHRDLKGENVLLMGPEDREHIDIRLIDFGLATYNVGPRTTIEMVAGTPYYMAPEIVANLSYTQQCDIWSIGVLLYMMLCGYPPFQHEETEELQNIIMKGKYEFPAAEWEHVTPSAKSLIQSMLKVDPAARITAKEILLHPWITGKTNARDSANLETVLSRMKAYNAERRFKRAIITVIAMNRFLNGIKKPTSTPLLGSIQIQQPAESMLLTTSNVIPGHSKLRSNKPNSTNQEPFLNDGTFVFIPDQSKESLISVTLSQHDKRESANTLDAVSTESGSISAELLAAKHPFSAAPGNAGTTTTFQLPLQQQQQLQQLQQQLQYQHIPSTGISESLSPKRPRNRNHTISSSSSAANHLTPDLAKTGSTVRPRHRSIDLSPSNSTAGALSSSASTGDAVTYMSGGGGTTGHRLTPLGPVAVSSTPTFPKLTHPMPPLAPIQILQAAEATNSGYFSSRSPRHPGRDEWDTAHRPASPSKHSPTSTTAPSLSSPPITFTARGTSTVTSSHSKSSRKGTNGKRSAVGATASDSSTSSGPGSNASGNVGAGGRDIVFSAHASQDILNYVTESLSNTEAVMPRRGLGLGSTVTSSSLSPSTLPTAASSSSSPHTRVTQPGGSKTPDDSDSLAETNDTATTSNAGGDGDDADGGLNDGAAAAAAAAAAATDEDDDILFPPSSSNVANTNATSGNSMMTSLGSANPGSFGATGKMHGTGIPVLSTSHLGVDRTPGSHGYSVGSPAGPPSLRKSDRRY